ncbi:hypothetical protein STEG23_033514 [Scotinomys teguina]
MDPITQRPLVGIDLQKGEKPEFGPLEPIFMSGDMTTTCNSTAGGTDEEDPLRTGSRDRLQSQHLRGRSRKSAPNLEPGLRILGMDHYTQPPTRHLAEGLANECLPQQLTDW